ncbi:MAG: hypothetical protein LUG60_00970 [Erysipelotrichaceae bacterium]|nr:hypothetical protein [Erysipelotrichaceae bacterium]
MDEKSSILEAIYNYWISYKCKQSKAEHNALKRLYNYCKEKNIDWDDGIESLIVDYAAAIQEKSYRAGVRDGFHLSQEIEEVVTGEFVDDMDV